MNTILILLLLVSVAVNVVLYLKLSSKPKEAPYRSNAPVTDTGEQLPVREPVKKGPPLLDDELNSDQAKKN